MVIRNAYLVTRDYYAAEDICQETFVRLNARLDQIPDENVRAWLLRTSRRLALDHQRDEGRCGDHPAYKDWEEEMEECAASDCFDLSELLEKREEMLAKKETLLLLKEQRPLWYDVLLMSSVEGMRNPAIGRQQGVTPSLVSKWKERAERWLRERYTRDYLDEE